MRTMLKVCALAVVAGSAVVLPRAGGLHAQGATGKVEGTVKNQSGAPMAGVQVLIVGSALQAVTDERGYFLLNNVPAGSVTLRARYIGYAPLEMPNVRILAGRTMTVDLIVAPGLIEAPEPIPQAARPPELSRPAAPQAARPPEPLPQFPWPPPQATARVVIPRGLVTRPVRSGAPSAPDTLGYVADSIESALRRADIEWAVYAVGDSGFAYVTRAERIRATGEPFPPPDRFPDDIATATGTHGFLALIISRFRARPGFFRIIAVVVTSRPVLSSGRPLLLDAATQLIHGGMATVPAALRRRAVRDLETVALVYEFERPSAADSVALRASPLVSARQHLAFAGLWTQAQLGAHQ
ncbi:MAG: carboxypeptidase-like regulatory domain-containing protein [Gemmatimonadales bacterium]